MVVIISFLFIVLGLRKLKLDEEKLSLQQTSSIKGICAYLIMLGHIGGSTNSILLFPIEKMGVLIVGIFFFLSGYFICSNIENKENYIKFFLKKHLLSILLPLIITYSIKYILCFLLEIDGYGALGYFDLTRFFEFTNWFVIMIALLYILTVISYKSSAKYYVYILACVTLIIMYAIFVLKGDRLYFGGALCYPLGMYLYKAKNSDAFKPQISLGCSFILILLMVFGIISFFYFGDYSFLGDFLGRNVAVICFTLLSYNIMNKISVVNKFNLFLGYISYEIYLTHLMLLQIILLLNIHISWMGLYVVVVPLTLAMAWMSNKLSGRILNLFVNRR